MSSWEKKSKCSWLLILTMIQNVLVGSVILLLLFLLGFDKKFKDLYLTLIIISGSVIIICALTIIIINGITKLKWGGDSDCRKVWEPIISRLSNEYSLKMPNRIGRGFDMSPFFGNIILNKAYLTWRRMFWEFPPKHIPDDDDFRNIVSSITISQALVHSKTPKDEGEKREMVRNRVFAYDYEDFIFEMFSRGAIHYSDFAGWTIDSNYSIPYEDFKSECEHRFLVNSEEASVIISSLYNKRIIWYWNRQEGVKMGDVLVKYWNVVSCEDMNFNKYCRLHKVSNSNKAEQVVS